MVIEAFQLDFFKDPEISRVESDIYAIKESTTKVRKKLFAENGKLRKEVDELKSRLDILERFICIGE